MKKLLIGLCALLASTATMAASANKMTMVTYFPVKYVAYSQVDVTKQMDIGLTSACQMNLGCATDEGFNTGKSLRVNNLLKIAGGKLELNDAPAIVGSTAIIGSGNGTADFDFETNLRVRNYKQGYTLQADNMYLSELNLFGYKFPACSGETMSWQKLKLKNKDEVYLVCGEAEDAGCDIGSKPAAPSARACNSCGTQSATVECNTSTNKWEITWGNCSVSSSLECRTYSWKRDASMDCVFNPANSSEDWLCPMASSSDNLGPLGVGNNCNEVVKAAPSQWGKGDISVYNNPNPPSGSCEYEGDLLYYHSTYGAQSLGAKYTYGCVAYVCEQD